MQVLVSLKKITWHVGCMLKLPAVILAGSVHHNFETFCILNSKKFLSGVSGFRLRYFSIPSLLFQRSTFFITVFYVLAFGANVHVSTRAN